VVPLGQIVDVLDSKRRPITKRDRTSGPYPYYGATGVLDWVSGFIFDEPLVLVGEDGAKWGAGDKSAFPISGKTWVNNHAHALRPHRDRVIAEWLVYFLNAADLSDFISGMTVPKLNQGQLREIQIPIPPLEEQKRIVAVLDQAFAALDRACAHAEANLAEAELLRMHGAGRLLSRYAGSAPKKYLGQLAEFRNGLNFSRHSSGETVKVAGVGDFKNNFWLPVDALNSATIEGQLSESDKLRAGDILTVRSNGNKELIGRVMLVGAADEAISFSGFVIRVRLIAEGIKPEFLCHYMKSKGVVAHLLAGGGGANISNLNQGILSNLPVSVPSLEDQQDFVDSMNQLNTSIEKLVKVAVSKLADLAQLRQSLLQKAFSGQLT